MVWKQAALYPEDDMPLRGAYQKPIGRIRQYANLQEGGGMSGYARSSAQWVDVLRILHNVVYATILNLKFEN